MKHGDSQIKAVIFDIGATLVTGPPVAPNKVIAGFLESVTAASISSVIMTTDLASAECVCSALEARFGTLPPDAIKGITELYNAQSSAAVEIDGATETVLSLKKHGLKIGLLSDIWNPYYASVEKALPGVIDAADAIALSCKTGSRKPCRDNFTYILNELGIQPQEAVMVGDTYTHDILPALEMGMSAVWVLARPDREAESIISVLNNNALRPTATVANITEIVMLGLWPAATSCRT